MKKKPFCNHNGVKTGGLWQRVQVFVLSVHVGMHTHAQAHRLYILELPIRCVKRKN